MKITTLHRTTGPTAIRSLYGTGDHFADHRAFLAEELGAEIDEIDMLETEEGDFFIDTRTGERLGFVVVVHPFIGGAIN